MVSIKKIAEVASVSTSTASFILNGKGNELRISKETQKKVLDIARELGYSPNIAARRLRSGNKNRVPIIAILWTVDTRVSLISRFLKGIHLGFRGYGNEFELLIQPYENSKLKNVKNLFTGDHFNGAIIANASDGDLEFLENNEVNVPIVLYQRKSNKYSSVLVDSFESGGNVAELFYSRRHTKVGIIYPNISSQAVKLRKKGFIKCLNQYGVCVSNNHLMKGEFSEEGGYQCAVELLKQDNLPTAIFSLSDQMAIGALAAFYEAGIKVPADIEIIGYDNNESSGFSVPPLSTIHLPVEDMANECVNLLLDVINQKADQPIVKKFETSMVIRKSCGGGL